MLDALYHNCKETSQPQVIRRFENLVQADPCLASAGPVGSTERDLLVDRDTTMALIARPRIEARERRELA
jgi:hypothetical protein